MTKDSEWVDWFAELDVTVATCDVSFPSQERYRYSQIDKTSNSIRLVQIYPGKTTTEVRCRLDVHSLAAAPAYTALSYTWGHPDDSCHVILNGRRLPVRKNLHRFVLQVSRRRSWANRFFWIDALCIDQTNAAERLHQVAQMAQIYETAESVLIWLGPSYEDSGLAVRTINGGSIPKYLWHTPAGTAVRRLCQRSYWTRLWVVQELTLAKSARFLCGTHTMTWKKLERFVSAALAAPIQAYRSQYAEQTAFLNSEALRMIEQVLRSREQTELYEQVLSFQQLHCSEPRDRIYAILGIAKRGLGSIVPDYRRPLRGLLHDVLREHHQIEPPRTLESVMQQCQALATLMRLEPNAMMSFSSPRRTSGIPTLSHLKSIPVPDDATLRFPHGAIFMYWWALAHDHRPVQDVWHARFGHRCCNPEILPFLRSAVEGEVLELQNILDHGRHHQCPYACCSVTSRVAEGPFHFVDDLGYRSAALLLASKCGHLDVVQVLAGGSSVLVHEALEYLRRHRSAIRSCEHCQPYLRMDPRIHATPIYEASPAWFRLLLEADEVDVGVDAKALGQNTQQDVPWLRKLKQSIRLEVVGEFVVACTSDANTQVHRACREIFCLDQELSVEEHLTQMSAVDAGRWRHYPTCRLQTFAMGIILMLQHCAADSDPPHTTWPESAESMLTQITKTAIVGLGLESEEIWPRIHFEEMRRDR